MNMTDGEAALVAAKAAAAGLEIVRLYDGGAHIQIRSAEFPTGCVLAELGPWAVLDDVLAAIDSAAEKAKE